MQFGVFSTGYLQQDPPTTGAVVNAKETIRETLLLAKHAEDVGLDVFALGEHHNNPFFTSSPAMVLAHVAAATTSIHLTTSMALITTDDPVRIAEEYALLQYLSEGRSDVMFGVTTDAAGRTVTARCHVAPLSMQRTIGDSPPVWANEPAHDTVSRSIWVLAPGWQGGWHTNPQRQLVVVLSGQWWVETQDGIRTTNFLRK